MFQRESWAEVRKSPGVAEFKGVEGIEEVDRFVIS
jgi:hypothetical protein